MSGLRATATTKVVKNNFGAARAAATGPALEAASRGGAELLLKYARDNVERTFVKNPTGALRDSLKAIVTLRGHTQISWSVGSRLVYARIQELGGIIRVKSAPWLVWKDENGGWHRAKMVILPARPYLRPAVDDHKDDMLRKIMDLWKAAIRRATP